MDLVRVLNSIGKENFVAFYEEYEKYYLSKNRGALREELALKLLNENGKADKLSGQYTRINCARRIFEGDMVKDALEIIVKARVSQETKKKAMKLLEAI